MTTSGSMNVNSESQTPTGCVSPSGSAAVLLRNLIDYAGLFPPASLAMTPAMANYEGYSHSEFRWILGRFILSASRLGEFEDVLARLSDRHAAESAWGLSVLLGADAASDLARIAEFKARATEPGSNLQATIQSAEVKAASPKEIERLAALVPANLETYFEIPWDSPPAVLRDCIAALAACGGRAKLRAGGETADKFPSPENVIEFIALSASAQVPFKATAGLHHPVRSRHRLTYQPDSPSGIMHGFLNVFLASAFLRAGIESEVAVELLKEGAAANFRFDSEGVVWRGHRLSERELVASRKDFAISFGSCSFTEPIDDLRALHLL